MSEIVIATLPLPTVLNGLCTQRRFDVSPDGVCREVRVFSFSADTTPNDPAEGNTRRYEQLSEQPAVESD